MSYDAKFRELVLRYIDEGKPYGEVQSMFRLGKNTIRDWIELRTETGGLANRPLERGFRKIDRAALREDVTLHPDDYDGERADRFGVSRSGIQYARAGLGITRKKKTPKAREQDETERRLYLEVLELIPEEERIYIDESGVEAEPDREYGYAPAGEPVVGEVSGKRAAKTNVVAAKHGDEIIEAHEYGCNMNSGLFEFWLLMLLKCVAPGSWLIMDNARFHRPEVLARLARAKGCYVLFLPAYSPDLNPIEKEWANLKAFLRSHRRLFDSTSQALWHYFQPA